MNHLRQCETNTITTIQYNSPQRTIHKNKLSVANKSSTIKRFDFENDFCLSLFPLHCLVRPYDVYCTIMNLVFEKDSSFVPYIIRVSKSSRHPRKQNIIIVSLASWSSSYSSYPSFQQWVQEYRSGSPVTFSKPSCWVLRKRRPGLVSGAKEG